MADELTVIADGLLFPEGPVAMSDGSVILVELARGTLSRVAADGTTDVVAHLDGGPNGAAMGPDGRMYVCNNGGFDDRSDPSGFFGALGMPRSYLGGSIQVVDLNSGSWETLYTHCDGNRLSAPNDIVFDANGGFWFTDLGKSWDRQQDHGGLYYAQADGSDITEVVYPLKTPNGVALSPDHSVIYVAETDTCRVYQWPVESPGVVDRSGRSAMGGELLYAIAGTRRFDSMAVDNAGNVCVGTLGRGGAVTVIAPDGTAVEVATGDTLTTNICFGGPDLTTAYVTCSLTGSLQSMQWPRPGAKLAFSG
ncbi:MAG: SMP-30/gluconolactonase/LRE family protein [Acidimicrobiales bacterium]